MRARAKTTTKKTNEIRNAKGGKEKNMWKEKGGGGQEQLTSLADFFFFLVVEWGRGWIGDNLGAWLDQAVLSRNERKRESEKEKVTEQESRGKGKRGERDRCVHVRDCVESSYHGSNRVDMQYKQKPSETKVTTTINKEHTHSSNPKPNAHTRMGIWHATHTCLSLPIAPLVSPYPSLTFA